MVIYFVSFTHTARYELLLRHVYKIIKKWFLLEKGHFITWMSNLLCIIVYNNFFSCLLSPKQPSISYIGGRTLVTGTLKGKGSRGSSYRVNWVNFDQGQQSLV